MVERLLTYSPDDRLTPDDALAHPFFSPAPMVQPASGGAGSTGGGAGSNAGAGSDDDDKDMEMLTCWEGMASRRDTSR